MIRYRKTICLKPKQRLNKEKIKIKDHEFQIGIEIEDKVSCANNNQVDVRIITNL